MKRSPLARKTPMKRTRMRRVPRSTSYSRRERDLDRMGWIKRQHCALLILNEAMSIRGAELHFGGPVSILSWRGGEIDFCAGVVEAHHAGLHGLSHKAPDDTCIPLCDHHHDALTDRRGVFSGWPRGALKEWELAMVAHYQRVYAERAPTDEPQTF